MNAIKKDFIHQLRNENRKLTSTQKKLRQYLLDHVVDVGYMSLKELAKNVGVSEVSILNFCSLMGCDSYISMREQLRDYMRSQANGLFLNPPAARFLDSEGEFYRYCTCVTDSHNAMIRNLDPAALERCARTLIDAENILIFGHDMSKMAADYLTSRLTYLHIRCLSANLGDNDTVQVLLAGMSPRDSAVIFSFPPYYMPTGDVADYVHHCGANLIAIANNTDSPAVTEYGLNFLCQAQNPYFFNSMSVPIHFAEILAYCIGAIMGKKAQILCIPWMRSETISATTSCRGDE